jgi:hypothetical protein
VMLEFRIGINECSFGSRIAAARCHVANLGRRKPICEDSTCRVRQQGN